MGGRDSLAQKNFPGGCPGGCIQLQLTETQQNIGFHGISVKLVTHIKSMIKFEASLQTAICFVDVTLASHRLQYHLNFNKILHVSAATMQIVASM